MSAHHDPIDGFRADLAQPDDWRQQRMAERFRELALQADADDPPPPLGDLVPGAPGEAATVPGAGGRVVDGGFSRRRALALFGAAAAAVAGVVAVRVGGDGAPGVVDTDYATDAAPSIDDLVTLVASRPARTLGPGEYYYQRTERMVGVPDGAAYALATQELWAAADRSGRFLDGAVYSYTEDGQRLEPPVRDVVDETFEPQADGALGHGLYGWGYHELRALPTDPAELRTSLYTRLDEGVRELAALAGSFLVADITPPELRGAVVRILVEDGYRSVGAGVDRRGRVGWVLRLDGDDGAAEVVLDRHDGRTLGLLFGPSVDEPTLPPEQATRWTTYEAAGIVTSVDEVL